MPNSYVYSKGGTATINVTAQNYDKKPVQTAFQVTDDPLELAARRQAGEPSLRRRARPTPAAKAQVKLTIPSPASSACW